MEINRGIKMLGFLFIGFLNSASCLINLYIFKKYGHRANFICVLISMILAVLCFYTYFHSLSLHSP